MTSFHLHSLAPLLCLVSACGSAIKGEGLEDSGDPPLAIDTGVEDDPDTDDDTGPPPEPTRGDVIVEYTMSWELGDTKLEICTDALSFEDVDTSYRAWTLWTDAGIELDLDNLPASAPIQAPVGDGTTVNPGSYRFVVDQETDSDLSTYDALVADGNTPVCLVSSGPELSLRSVQVPEPVPDRSAPITAVELRLSVIWTER